MYITVLDIRVRHSILHLHICSAKTFICICSTLWYKNNNSIESVVLFAFHRTFSVCTALCGNNSHMKLIQGTLGIGLGKWLPNPSNCILSPFPVISWCSEDGISSPGNSIWNQWDQVPLLLSICKLSFRKENGFSQWKVTVRE